MSFVAMETSVFMYTWQQEKHWHNNGCEKNWIKASVACKSLGSQLRSSLKS